MLIRLFLFPHLRVGRPPGIPAAIRTEFLFALVGRLKDRLAALRTAPADIFTERVCLTERLDGIYGYPCHRCDTLVSESLTLKLCNFLFFIFCHEKNPPSPLTGHENGEWEKKSKKISPPRK